MEFILSTAEGFEMTGPFFFVTGERMPGIFPNSSTALNGDESV
jgi:hypothetical protein